jgi:ribosomal protein S18 acetylase RimI-like enzyme
VNGVAAVPGAELCWTAELLAPYVEGVHAAGQPYFDFLFGDRETASRVLAEWANRGSSEVSTRRARLLPADAVLAGGFIVLSGSELARCRQVDTMALMRTAEFGSRSLLLDRIAATRGLFADVEPGDAYLSKFWVHPDFRGRGVGRDLLALVEAEAVRIGAPRLVLDVSAANTRAVELYRHGGFDVVARHASPAGLEYVAMVKQFA